MALKIEDKVGVINMYFNSGKSKIYLVDYYWLITHLALTLANKTFTHNIETLLVNGSVFLQRQYIYISCPCGSNLNFGFISLQTCTELLNV